MSEDNHHYDLDNYVVYIVYEDKETYYEYIGADKDRAQKAFDKAKQHLSQNEVITEDATLIYKNAYTEEIIDTYNTLDDV